LYARCRAYKLYQWKLSKERCSETLQQSYSGKARTIFVLTNEKPRLIYRCNDICSKSFYRYESYSQRERECHRDETRLYATARNCKTKSRASWRPFMFCRHTLIDLYSPTFSIREAQRGATSCERDHRCECDIRFSATWRRNTSTCPMDSATRCRLQP